MSHLVRSALKITGTVFAAGIALSPVNALTDGLGQLAGLDLNEAGELVGLEAIPEGGRRTVAGVIQGFDGLNEAAAGAAAATSNAVGLNNIAGVKELAASDFTENGGIAVKSIGHAASNIGNIGSGIANVAEGAVKNPGAVATGAGLMFAGATFAPNMVNDAAEFRKGATQTVVNVGHQAASMAQTTGGHVSRLMESRQQTAAAVPQKS